MNINIKNTVTSMIEEFEIHYNEIKRQNVDEMTIEQLIAMHRNVTKCKAVMNELQVRLHATINMHVKKSYE